MLYAKRFIDFIFCFIIIVVNKSFCSHLKNPYGPGTMRRENCLDNCKVIFHISPVECLNSVKSFRCACLKTLCSFRAEAQGLFSLEELMGVISERKISLVMDINAFFFPLCSHLYKYSVGVPLDFQGRRHTEWLRAGVCMQPGMVQHRLAQEKKMSPEMSIWGFWMVTVCLLPSSGTWLEHSKLRSGLYRMSNIALMTGVFFLQCF